jgi:multicomponent Na+:H+ antiporter subunit G
MSTSIITIILIYIGIAFIVIAAIGIIRMPDVYTRMSAAAKAVTFGTGFILLGVVIHFNDTSVFLKIAAIFLFLLFSLATAAHVIGLAAYKDQTKMTILTFVDELKDDIAKQDAPKKALDPDMANKVEEDDKGQ